MGHWLCCSVTLGLLQCNKTNVAIEMEDYIVRREEWTRRTVRHEQYTIEIHQS